MSRKLKLHGNGISLLFNMKSINSKSKDIYIYIFIYACIYIQAYIL